MNCRECQAAAALAVAEEELGSSRTGGRGRRHAGRAETGGRAGTAANAVLVTA